MSRFEDLFLTVTFPSNTKMNVEQPLDTTDHYHADLQPTVGRREEERGDVVGIGELQ